MAWNPSSNTLTRGFTKIAANGQGDLQLALNRTTCMSHIQLICDIDANGNRVNKTNPAARYKPFCYDGTFATEAAREAARVARNCGLTMRVYNTLQGTGGGIGVWDAALASTPGEFCWAYEPPRANQSSEPKRANDFINETSDSSGYRSDSLFGFDYRLYPDPIYKGTSSPIIQTSTAVLHTNDMIDLSDLQGNGSVGGYTSIYHGYYNLTNFYFTVAIAVHGASGPEWVMSYQTIPQTGCEYFNNKMSYATSRYYDVVFFWFKPRNGTTIYTGGTSPLDGDYILAPYPYQLLHYVVPQLDLDITGSMANDKKSVSISVATRSGTQAFTNAYLLVMNGGQIWPIGTDPVVLFRSKDSPFTTTPTDPPKTRSFDDPIPDTATFVLRVYTDSSTYLDQGFEVLRPI